MRHKEFAEVGAVVVGIDVDSPAQHAAMIEKLNLPFSLLSDPDRSLAIEPYDLMNLDDPRNLAIPATVVIGPYGNEIMRTVSRDYADRPFEDEVLEKLRELQLEPVEQPPPNPGAPEAGPKAMPFDELRSYFRGAKFGAKAIGLRTDNLAESDGFGALMDRYMEAVIAMFRIKRDKTNPSE
ncbi:MAG: redoxin domain-containing protein [Acidimicrobiia bacterium]|nr:redoxin domain-containing protein [Acidimicrobiia bacterium]